MKTRFKYDTTGNWYKGNLHSHTVNSDGFLTAKEVIARYAEEGYDFIAITDHWKAYKQNGRGLNSPILVLEGPARMKLLSSLRRESSIAKKFHVPIVISSGVVEKRFLRKPREMAALASLFDLDEVSALEAVSHNPGDIVRRNREKLSSKFVAPGIRIIREGKNC